MMFTNAGAFLLWVVIAAQAAQQADLPARLHDAVLHDAACSAPAGSATAGESKLSMMPIRAGGREAGAIVFVRDGCHCEATNCDALVYLRKGDDYELAVHEKYASLHTMKIVKRGMPSLTGTRESGPLKAETTVYDWNGKTYEPTLCATVIKGKKVPSITQHACKRNVL